MKKAGLITVHESTNYGALLQAYALRESIEKQGVDCEIINHNRFKSNNMNKKKNKFKIFKVKNVGLYFDLFKRNPSIIKIKLSSKKSFKKINQETKVVCEKFMDDFLSISKRRYTEIEEIKNDPPIYDYYICGSDQIWNPNRSNYFEPFFLTFAPRYKTKIAYAPSIALNSIPNDLVETYKKHLKDFEYISVREEQGAEIISNIVGRKIPALLDPTFLLDYKEWNEIAIGPGLNFSYILCYFRSHKELSNLRSEINNLAKRLDAKVVVLPGEYGVLDSDWIALNCIGPREYLGLVRESKFVITNSFHGVALSINYNKDFFVCGNNENSGIESRFSRIANILGKLELEDRVISDKEKLNYSSINYSIVNQLLENERKKSYEFLSVALRDNQNDDEVEPSITKNNKVNPNNISIVAKDDCVGCNACFEVCPYDSITMRLDDEGFYRPYIDEKKCKDCKACLNVCPAIKPVERKSQSIIKAYGAWNKDISARLSGSSGGVFSALAKTFMASGGHVLGAAFDEKIHLKHIVVKNETDLERCTGSKYIQSDIDGKYNEVKKLLKAGEKVMFSGTPCQVAGLKTFLGVHYENLITCDFICLGVSSVSIFNDYINDIELEENSRVLNYRFRDKRLGWHRPSISIEFQNGNIKKNRWRNDIFIQGFSKNKTLRIKSV